VLANVVLHELDRVWEDRCSQLGQLSRYADDAVVLCRTEVQARDALWRIGAILGRLKLTLHPTKTQVVFVGSGRQGFDFLGFHCRKLESWKYRGYRYLHKVARPSGPTAYSRQDQSDHCATASLARTRQSNRG
jgi:RNA-directed DNA polymerase